MKKAKWLSLALCVLFISSGIVGWEKGIGGKDEKHMQMAYDGYEKNSGIELDKGREIAKNVPQKQYAFENSEIKNILDDLKKGRSKNIRNISPDFLTVSLYTKCGDVEKRIPIQGLKAIFDLAIEGLPINVDNDDNTGQNGNDVRAKYNFIPGIFKGPAGWTLIFAIFSKIERIGEEIKDSYFEVYAEFSISLEIFPSAHTFRVGCQSPQNEEIPNKYETTFFVLPYLYYEDRPMEYGLWVKPTFDNEGEHNITLIADYTKEKDKVTYTAFRISYEPAVEFSIGFTHDISLNLLQFNFDRISTKPSIITYSYAREEEGKRNEISFSIDKMPEQLSFSFTATPKEKGGTFEYKSTDNFNATFTIHSLLINNEQMGEFKRIRLEYIPKYVSAEWVLREIDGYVDINTDSSDTTLILCDDLTNPSVYFSMTNFTSNAKLSWTIAQKGYFNLRADNEGPKAKFIWVTDNRRIEINAQLKTDYCDLAWNLESNGSINFDTNWKWLISFSFNITFDTLVGKFGLLIGANFLRAEDYIVGWVLPIQFDSSGELEFIGDISLAVMIFGAWYYILVSP